jgi:hypothetical protein
MVDRLRDGECSRNDGRGVFHQILPTNLTDGMAKSTIECVARTIGKAPDEEAGESLSDCNDRGVVRDTDATFV